MNTETIVILKRLQWKLDEALDTKEYLPAEIRTAVKELHYKITVELQEQ